MQTTSSRTVPGEQEMRARRRDTVQRALPGHDRRGLLLWTNTRLFIIKQRKEYTFRLFTQLQGCNEHLVNVDRQSASQIQAEKSASQHQKDTFGTEVSAMAPSNLCNCL